MEKVIYCPCGTVLRAVDKGVQHRLIRRRNAARAAQMLIAVLQTPKAL